MRRASVSGSRLVSRPDVERAGLLAASDRAAYLRAHSRLPGPRGNLELLDVAARACDRSELVHWAALEPAAAPENTPDVFLVAVGVVGLGCMIAAGDRSLLPGLRRMSADPRWRVREAVAMALQVWGDADTPALVAEMERWADGSPLEGRAAMAALCEPRLLGDRSTVERTLAILDRLTLAVREAADPRVVDIRVLRQALGYGWSVAVAADPEVGIPALDRWLTDRDPDVRWIVRQNLAKARLSKAAPEWIERARATVSSANSGPSSSA
jgi:hypothetical protein